MQYPIIDNLIYAYLKNGWTGLNGRVIENSSHGIEVNYNQFVNYNNYRLSIPAFNGNIENINDYWTASGRWITTGQFRITETGFNITNNHIYGLFADGFLNGNFLEIRSGTSVFDLRGEVGQLAFIKRAVNSGSSAYIMINSLGANVDQPEIYIKPRAYDLTKMFGEEYANEMINNPNWITQLQTLLPDDYNTGERLFLETDIPHRLKLPVLKYFPHRLLDALISAADGQHTEEEKEILRHYLTPLGIGGI